MPLDVVQREFDARAAEFEGLAKTREELVAWWHGYAAEIRYTDEQIGRLLDGLGRLGRLQDAVVCLTADHGEGLYEHGERGHGVDLHEEMVRVPLILSLPDVDLGGWRHRPPVVLEDLYPTLAHAALGRPLDEPAYGVDLWPAILQGAEVEPRPVFLERPHYAEERWRKRPGGRRPWGVLTAALWGGHKLVEGPQGEVRLFGLVADPAESVDLTRRRPELVESLGELQAAWRTDRVTPEPVLGADESEERLRMLRALGYSGDDER